MSTSAKSALCVQRMRQTTAKQLPVSAKAICRQAGTGRIRNAPVRSTIRDSTQQGKFLQNGTDNIARGKEWTAYLPCDQDKRFARFYGNRISSHQEGILHHFSAGLATHGQVQTTPFFVFAVCPALGKARQKI